MKSLPQPHGKRSGLMSRKTFMISGAAAAGLAITTTALSASACASQSKPRHSGINAVDFIDSIGINTHWAYPDTPYGQHTLELIKLIQHAGIRHTRGTPLHLTELLRRSIRTTALVDIGPDGSGTPMAQVSSILKHAQSGAIAAIEGPNEPDLFWTRANRSYQGKPFPLGAIDWQKDLWKSVRSHSAFKRTAVLGPALGGTYWGSPNPLGRNTLQPYVDFGNFHPYPRDNPFAPRTSYAGIEAYYWNTNYPSNTLENHPVELTSNRVPYGNRAMMATETGYSTWARGSSVTAQGIYTPRIFLENYRLGIRRSYVYELIDEHLDAAGTNKEAHFGLLNYDLSPKPSFTSLKALISHTRPLQGATTRLFEPRIDVSPPKGYDKRFLHHLLISRGANRYCLVLWHEIAAEDVSAVVGTPGRPNPLLKSQPRVNVQLDMLSDSRVSSVYCMNDQGKAIKAHAFIDKRVVELGVDGRVTFVHVNAK